MPHFICRWPGGDVLLASVESRQELDAILQERCEPGVCKVARYHGPLVLELTPDIPGAPCASAERFKLGPACPAFQAAWQTRLSSGDVDLLAADGSTQRVHRLVLQCRLPVLGGQPVALTTSQVRLRAVPDGSCLLSLVEFLYLDDVQQQDITHSLYMAALHCGLERLVTRCEGHYAHQLEVQLHSWPGLSEAQHEGVLDSFIGWAGFAEQQGRQEMLQLCTHSLALHQAAAQSRPSWESLSPRTASLVRLMAASTAPPIIHRQVLPNGNAILPVLSNPSTDSPGHPAAAPAAGQPPAAPASTVSVEAEAFAAAGGRMTSWEWQQLQRFRDAVTECRSIPDASPLLLKAEQLARHSLLTGEPGVNFAVKQAVLTPHRRLMDSVCRFAFPATHGLLASGWTLRAPGQQPPAADAAAQAGAASQAGARQQPQQQQQQQEQLLQGLQQRQQGLQPTVQGMVSPAPVPVPVPAPDVRSSSTSNPRGQPQEPHAVPVLIKREADAHMQESISSGSDNGSAAGRMRQPFSQQGGAAAAAAAAGAATEPAQQAGLQPFRPAAAGAPAGSLLGNVARHVDPSWQLRAQAAAGAAAQHLGAGQVLESRPSWGSAAGTDPQARSTPQHGRQGGLERLQSGVQSWGTGLDGAHHSPASHAGASTATGLTGDGVLLLCQHTAAAAGAGAAAPAVEGEAAAEASDPQNGPMQLGVTGAPLARPWGSDGASSADGTPSAEAAAPEQSPMVVLQQAGPVLEGAGSIAGQGFEATSSPVAPGVHQLMAAADGVVDLPLFRRLQANMGHHASRAEAMGSSAGTRPGDAPAALEPAAAPGQAPALNAQQQQQQAQGAASIPRISTSRRSISAAGRRSSSSAAAGSSASLPALQRALVEDFVLYEEASAARQHVVGILLAVEQGDAAAGQRLLAPTCAELIAATAPAAVPNRLAPYLGSPAVVNVAASARAAGLPAADVSAAVAVAAAEEYTSNTQGVGRLLGTASSSRAALEASPRQLRQQRQQQQQQLRRALQQVSNRVPWLARLLTPLQQSMGVAADGETTAAGTPSAGGSPSSAEQQGAAGQEQVSAGAACNSPAADAGQQELQSAVVELIMQLPELLHGLPGPALLTYDQFRQRYTQAQQLAAHAMQLLLPGAEGDEGAAAAAAVNGVAAELAASGLLAAASAAMAASQTAAPGDGTSGSPGQQANQPGQLFASILDSLRTPGTSPPAAAVGGVPPGAEGSNEAEGLAAAVSRGVAGAGAAAAGFLSRTAAFAAANRLADGLIRPAGNMPAASLGLSRAGSIAGPGQLGAWRLPAAGSAGAAAAAAGPGGGMMGPPGMAAAAAAGVLGIGMLAPTGTGALLSGGLLAEGGVAGDSILDDMLHGNVRRITCHGLYELCAALAQPTGGVTSPPSAAAPQQQHPQQQQQQQAAEAQAVQGAAAYSDMETETSSVSTRARTAVMGQQVAEAVATVAAAAVAVESNRRSSNHNHSMGPPSVGLSGTKRRLSSSLDEQERPAKH